MSNILKSASKIILLMFGATISITYIYGVLTGKVVLDTKDFLIPAMAVMGFYFANKGDNNQPYAGK